MSGIGPSRHFVATQQFSHFRGKADIDVHAFEVAAPHGDAASSCDAPTNSAYSPTETILETVRDELVAALIKGGIRALLCRRENAGAVLGWGQFLIVALSFLIIAGVLFLAIKGINSLKKEEPPARPSEPSPEVKLLAEIRDLLNNS